MCFFLRSCVYICVCIYAESNTLALGAYVIVMIDKAVIVCVNDGDDNTCKNEGIAHCQERPKNGRGGGRGTLLQPRRLVSNEDRIMGVDD